jgi:hypothetical protein
MNHRRSLLMGAVASACVLLYASVLARAQEPKIYLDVDEVTGKPGELVTVPIFIENLPDTITGFQINVTLDRPDIMVIKDTIDNAGTLTEGWGGSTSQFGDFDLRITSHGGFPPGWTPIPPNTSGILIKLVMELYCDIPDTMQDRLVRIDISPVNAQFSSPGGELIMPVGFAEGYLTADLGCPHQGDIEPDGFITALDLTGIIATLFEGGPSPRDPCCPTFRFDFDCDGFVTALDLSVIIDHLFAGGSGPCTP